MLRRQVLHAGLAAAAVACDRRPSGAPTAPPPLAASTAAASSAAAAASTSEPVRCAVIGGMMTTGFFEAVAARFTATTGGRVVIASSGNKRMIVPDFERGSIDLITMHGGDDVTKLVAEGVAIEPEPWAMNDHVIVGPASDPAGIRGMKDAAAALAKIVAAGAPFVEHRGSGAAEVTRRLLADAHVALPEATTSRMPESANREDIVAFAAQKGAYTIVGRIPVQQGKMKGDGAEILVQGDARMARRYVALLASPSRFPGARVDAARRLSAFLRSPETQAFIATFGADKFGGVPPFAALAN